MTPPILRLLLMMSALPWLALSASGTAQAREATARIERITTGPATLESVRVQLDWPAQAAHGQLRVQVRSLVAPALGYHFRNLDWHCPLQRDDRGRWQCDGPLRSGRGAPVQLAVALDATVIDAALRDGDAGLAVHREAAAPDLVRVDLTAIPLAWTEALLARAWPQARLTGGRLDGRLAMATADAGPLRISGPLQLTAAALDTPDGRIAAQGLGARLDLDAVLGERQRIRLDGELRGGELLFGTTYVSLQQRHVGLRVDAVREPGQGWRLPELAWRDGGILSIEGNGSLAPELALQATDLQMRSADLALLRDGYLSGWLGIAGLAGLQLEGSASADLRVRGGDLRAARVELLGAAADDPRGRFSFEGLNGSIRYSADAPVHSGLSWEGGKLYGLGFGGVWLPFTSGGGALRLREAVTVPMLGGSARFEQLLVRPPATGQPLDVRFGLRLDDLDVAQLAQALDGPPFTGTLSGRIPQARYRDDRLDFDGGLSMQLFGGDVQVSSLTMERPFGVAPTLSADIALDDLDLQALTGVFGFGSISGKLDGRVDRLRLVDWQATAFDAALYTDRTAGVPQRISQRAVQDLSSVGGASFAGSLQAQLIGLFYDFGYSRIGIGCTLVDDVCTMEGLGSAGPGFIIVRGAGLPRLTVVGFNRRVDWPLLVERLGAVGAGDIKPVVE